MFKMRTLLLLLSALFCIMQFPMVSGAWIDEDTPEDKYKATSMIDHTEYELVSSPSNTILYAKNFHHSKLT